MEKSFPRFTMQRKKFSMPFLFIFVPQQILNLIRFAKLITSKIQTMSVVSKSLF